MTIVRAIENTFFCHSNKESIFQTLVLCYCVSVAYILGDSEVSQARSDCTRAEQECCIMTD